MRPSTTALIQALSQRIVVIDGAMGSMIQTYTLTEADFRGTHFVDHPQPLMGANDLLVLTRPDVIEEIHYQFAIAGAGETLDDLERWKGLVA